MKIAQVISSLEARHGGPSRSVLGLSTGLAQLGSKVDLLTTGNLEKNSTPVSPGLSVLPYPREWPESIARSQLLNQKLAAGGYDIIHHHALWQSTLHYAHSSARKHHVPLIISPRGMMSPWAWRHHRWKKQIASLLVHPGAFAAAAGWHATCDAEADDIRRLGFKQPVCVAPNGVIPTDAEQERREAAHWHEQLPALASRRVALFYSRLHSKKRVLELIDLWLSQPRDDWVLLIVGIPEQYTVNQLDTYLVRNGGIDRVIVHDGSHRPPPYAAASLFLLPSHSENFGLVVAEALVRGVPVLTTDATPWQELSRQGAGQCVPWARFGAEMDQLLLKSPAELRASGARARVWASAAFSWAETATKLGQFYAQIRSAW